MSRIDADQIPDCDCGGAWGCYECGTPLRRKYAPARHVNPWGSPEVQQYLAAIRERREYTQTFPVGARGGALVDLGGGNSLECFAPWEDKREGLLLPLMPMPLATLVHDPGHGKPPEAWMVEACEKGLCSCDSRPTGWKLTRPLIRAMLGVSDSVIAEHAGELPGRLPCWCVCVNTVTFVTEVIFGEHFEFPVREVSRAARAARQAARKCRPPRPRGRWPSRPRRK